MLTIACAIGRAHAAEEIGAALRACRAEADDARRLACYDRVIDRDSEPGQDEPAQAGALTAEESFGREGAMTRPETERKSKASRELEELVATAVGVSTRADGTFEITLDNGQVWKQNKPDPFFRLRVGDQVRIVPAALGSFMLSGPAKRSTRATRIR